MVISLIITLQWIELNFCGTVSYIHRFLRNHKVKSMKQLRFGEPSSSGHLLYPTKGQKSGFQRPYGRSVVLRHSEAMVF